MPLPTPVPGGWVAEAAAPDGMALGEGHSESMRFSICVNLWFTVSPGRGCTSAGLHISTLGIITHLVMKRYNMKEFQ